MTRLRTIMDMGQDVNSDACSLILLLVFRLAASKEAPAAPALP